MKEADFINRNKEKWAQFSQLTDAQASSPKVLSKQYIELTEDLSHAQTYFEKRSVRVYLNDLAKKVYTSLHKQKADNFRKFLDVWRISLPLEIYRSRKNLMFSLVIFLIWGTIGFVTTQMYPDYAKTFLSSGYVGETVENIAKGDPLAIYESQDRLTMFITITTNNIRVSFLMFILGITFTFGTHYLMMTNGIMVGVFQGFFVTKGLGIATFLGIWIHGAFEISSIVIAGAAGFAMGNAWLFPGSFSRFEALQIGAKRGVKIVLSIVPFLITAGWLESYATANYQDFPNWSKWAIILVSFGIILFYFVIYPILIARKYPEKLKEEYLPSIRKKKNPVLFKLRNSGQIVSDSLRVYANNIWHIMKINSLTTVPVLISCVLLQYTFNPQLFQYFHGYDWYDLMLGFSGFGFNHWVDLPISIVFMLAMSNLFLTCFYQLVTDKQLSYFRYFIKHIGGLMLVFCLTIPLLAFSGGLMFWINVLLLPIPVILATTIALKRHMNYKLSSKNGTFLKVNYGEGMLLTLILVVLYFFFMQPIAVSQVFGILTGNTDLLDAICSQVERLCKLAHLDSYLITNCLRMLVYMIFIILMLPIAIFMFGLQFFSTCESLESPNLNAELMQLGKRKKTYESDLDYE